MKLNDGVAFAIGYLQLNPADADRLRKAAIKAQVGEKGAKIMKAKIFVFLKHDDTASLLIDKEGEEILDHHGYMPHIGIFGGDQTELEIDNETGQIIGWKPITQEDLEGLKEDYKKTQ